MIFKNLTKKKIANSTILLLLIIFNLWFQVLWLPNIYINPKNKEDPFLNNDHLQTSETDYYNKEWITNGDFSFGSTNWSNTVTGDTSDVSMIISGGEASYTIEGETHIKEISDPINLATASNWVAFNKSEPAINPDTCTIDNKGFYVSHSWWDATPDQFTTINWRYNVSMGVDMSDYVINSATFDAIMNATVNRNVDAPGDTYAEYDNWYVINQAGIYDHALFYIEIADMALDTVYRIAYNKTNDLGRYDTLPQVLSYSDKSIEPTGDEQDLIYYITSVLDKDPGHNEFAIIAGIEIQCEDDYTGIDKDDWTALRIKSINLTFSYDKKIEPLTKASYNQNGDLIPDYYEIENATLNFKYKIDRDWTINTGSLNSEFRIIINNNQLGETVKLTTATSIYKSFKVGGVDVANFLTPNEEVNLSLQLYIGDEFTLDSDIIVSIDNVSLIIGYGIFTLPDVSTYDLILNDINRTIEKSGQVIFNEELNITFIYKNSLGDFISGATVELTVSGLPSLILDPDLTYDQYYTIINSTELGVGTSYLTLTASKRYHTTIEFQITITVVSRNTEIQLFLNGANETDTKEVSIPWNENLNITVRYLDIELGSNMHIDNAIMELTGAGAVKDLEEDVSNEQYELSINSNILGLGATYLTVYASKQNYTSLNIRFKVIVSLRTTYLDNVLLDGIESTSLEVEWNEMLDVSVSYNDSLTNNFIEDATVQLIGPTYSKILTQSGQNKYNSSINSFDFTIGNNFLTILAQKDNYSIASRLITIIVAERDTSIQIELNKTETTTIYYPYNELLNITAVYEDSLGTFINNANVELIEGSNIIDTLLEDAYNQYSCIINTTKLSLNVNLLTVYAKKDNYSAAFASITIIIQERDTDLEIILNGNPINTLQIPYGETLNITAVYNDLTQGFISGATVELWNGTTPLYTLDKSPSYNQYTRTININQLILGVNILSVYAKKENYSAALVSIIITVIERETVLDIFLEGLPGISINIDYGESINITAIYKDTTGVLLDNSVVELREGSTTKAILTWIPSFQQYYYSMDTSHLSLGTNLLAVYAKKQNYTAELVSITITVNERDTTLNVLLEGLESSTIEFYNISVNEYLNITAIYNDFTDVFIDGATVQLTGSGETRPLSLHPTFYQYNITLKVEDLGIGVHFLVVSAEKENYSSSIVNIKLNVLERRASLQLFVDTVNNLTLSRYITAEIDQILNISIFFRDFVDKSHLSGANVRLTGAINKNFTENLVHEYYNVSISSNNLGPGINFLTIFAQRDGYKSESIWFTIEVVEKISNLQLFLNNINKTLDKSIEVTVGELVNISIFYNDYSGSFIDNAEVIIMGEGISLNLTKHPLYNQYNVSINSNDLNFGINRLTLYAYKINYQPQTLIVVIEIVEKETDINIFLNGFDKTFDKTLTIPIRKLLNITINYFEFESGTPITGATIQVVGEGLLLNLTENPLNHYYSVTINTNLLDIGVRFLTVYCQRPNYQSYSALLRIQVDRIKTNISTVTGETVVNFIPGDNYRLKIRLYDLDFNLSVLNATVRYTWAYGQGDLTDEDNDGVYEALLSNLPVGTFLVTISVYAGDDYEFERFQITMNIVSPPENVLLFQILTIAGIAAAIGVSGYLLAYQKILKYPKQVRKIHKFKSKLKKPKSIGVEVQTREEVIDKHYSEEITALEKQIKKKVDPKSDISQPSNDKIDKTKEIELSKK